LLAFAALIVAVAGFVGVYFILFNGSSAAPLRLSSGPVSGGHLTAAAAAGTWSIAPSSIAGYRVREKLAFLPARSDAVGRTSDIAGTLTIARSGTGLTVTAASFLADVRTLKSDRSQRDAQIHRIGLQSARYPIAGFRLTRTIVLPSTALQGQVFRTTATGQLTIHGATRTVTIPITGRVEGSRVETVGSLTFPFSEFGMRAPNIAGFVSVENHATMEFDLRFQRGSSASNAARLRAIASARPSSSSSGPRGPGPGAGPGPNSKQFQAFTACMTRHGVKLAPGTPPNSNNPKMAAALKACGSLQPRPDQGPPSGSGQAP
jgi:polyisoprenoid-binding protein YceI